MAINNMEAFLMILMPLTGLWLAVVITLGLGIFCLAGIFTVCIVLVDSYRNKKKKS